MITYYKKFDFSIILDRPDLAFSPYIAALDIQYSHYTPYLWTFTIDSTGQVAYGRNFDELRDWLRILQKRLNLSADHTLLIIVDDLFSFFGNTKKELDYDAEPCVAKSHTDVLLIGLMGGSYHLHSYKAYFESSLEEDMPKIGIQLEEIKTDRLSERCELTQEEIDNSENRVLFISTVFRQEIDTRFQGSPRSLVLTKTARIERLISAEQRKESNKCNCNVISQIMKKNPITSEWGRNFVLPMLYKAFFGGVSFYEEGIIDKPFENAYSADITSAYVARMVLSKYPIGEFFEPPQPESYTDLFKFPYNMYAMLITFEARDLKLKPGGFAFLPSEMRPAYIDIKSQEELADRCEQICSTRIKKAKVFRATLTDIDFKLMLENYDIDGGLILENILASKYGYLPDYIQNVIIKLYSDKADAKQKKNELEKLGALTNDVEEEYDRIKSELARLYGIFTKKPIVERYVFNTKEKELIIADPKYISENRKYSPVLYQWGVFTTALVRKEIAAIRRALVDAASEERQIKVLSGDTDCVNFVGDAKDIIAEYNAKIKSQIEERAAALGVEPELLKDLGSLELKPYKKYKVTGLKQYCFIRETEIGDQFGYKVGGMSTTCKYFDEEFKTPEQRFNHFGLGLTIPAKWEPRKIKSCISRPRVEEWTDREGNEIRSEIQSYTDISYKRFTLYPIMDPSPLGNSIRNTDDPPTLEEIKVYARQIINPVYNPLELIQNKKKGVKK